MRESLSLFEDDVAPAAKPARRPRDRHLEAARRLARRIAGLPDHSEAQVETGQSICRHLLAMLNEELREELDEKPRDGLRAERRETPTTAESLTPHRH